MCHIIKEMKIYENSEIKDTILIPYYIQNVILFTSSACPLKLSCCYFTSHWPLCTLFSVLLRAAIMLFLSSNIMSYFLTVSTPSNADKKLLAKWNSLKIELASPHHMHTPTCTGLELMSHDMSFGKSPCLVSYHFKCNWHSNLSF